MSKKKQKVENDVVVNIDDKSYQSDIKLDMFDKQNIPFITENPNLGKSKNYKKIIDEIKKKYDTIDIRYKDVPYSIKHYILQNCVQYFYNSKKKELHFIYVFSEFLIEDVISRSQCFEDEFDKNVSFIKQCCNKNLFLRLFSN